MLDPDQAMRRRLMLEVVENQLRDNDPPATRETLERLLNEGIPREEAMNLLGCVVASEIFGVLKEQRPFDEERYVALLRRLPQLPWD